ncbi:V-set and immunoglobulin domain-containing protein 10-like protein, partial [Ophiophagus hannah]
MRPVYTFHHLSFGCVEMNFRQELHREWNEIKTTKGAEDHPPDCTPLFPVLSSFPLAVLVGNSVSLPIPFSLPSAQVQIPFIWRRNATILATGNLRPNFTVKIDPSFQSQFSVDPVNGNLNISDLRTMDSSIYSVEIFPLGGITQKGSITIKVYDRSYLCVSLEEVGNVSVVPPSAEVIEGKGSVAFNCTPVHGFVSWTKDGHRLGDNPRYLRSSGYLQIRDPLQTDAGVYSCTISNPFGNATGTANLTVYCEYTLAVTKAPWGSPRCSVTSVQNDSALLFICSWTGGWPAPNLTFQGLPGDKEEIGASKLQSLLVPPFPDGISGSKVTCLGHHVTGQANCTLIPEAPSGVTLSFQASSDPKGGVTMQLRCQGTFNPVEIEWFRDKHSLIPAGSHYRLSPDKMHLTIWNFTAPQDLGDYSILSMGAQAGVITIHLQSEQS